MRGTQSEKLYEKLHPPRQSLVLSLSRPPRLLVVLLVDPSASFLVTEDSFKITLLKEQYLQLVVLYFSYGICIESTNTLLLRNQIRKTLFDKHKKLYCIDVDLFCQLQRLAKFRLKEIPRPSTFAYSQSKVDTEQLRGEHKNSGVGDKLRGANHRDHPP